MAMLFVLFRLGSPTVRVGVGVPCRGTPCLIRKCAAVSALRLVSSMGPKLSSSSWDGSVSPPPPIPHPQDQSIAKSVAARDKVASEIMKEADANGDGAIDVKELKAW